MHSTLFVGAALFSASTFAQISIDENEANKVASDVVGYAASITNDPAFQTDLAQIASAIPSSVIAAAESNPEAFVEGLLTATAVPTWVSAIPTGAIDSLESLAAKPINAVEDLSGYIASLAAEPAVDSVLSVLATAVPTDVQSQLEADPVSFLENAITATTVPAYVTALPTDIQSDIASVINQGLSIIASDFEASVTAVPSITKKPSISLKISGTGAAKVSGYKGANSTSAVPFTGAASSVAVNTGIAGVLAVFGIVLAVL